MWVIFEGLDKAGKTTLEWEFMKATGFKHVIIDRGPVGYMVFDELFDRSTKLGQQNFIHQARKALKSGDFIVVYCKVSPEVAAKRLAEHSEKCPYDYEKAQKLYDRQVKRYYREDYVVVVDTDRPIARCVDQIVGKLKEVFKGEL